MQGIFDEAYVLVDPQQPGLSSWGPAVFLRLEDLPSGQLDEDPRISVPGHVYRVREAKEDGQGGVLLLLHEITL